MHEKGEGRPQQTLTTDPREEQPGQSWYDRPHDELVAAFRGYIDEREIALREQGAIWSPMRDHIVEDRLADESRATDDPKQKLRGDFFHPILTAWQLITYDRKDRWGKHQTAWSLSNYYEAPAAHRPKEARPEQIILTHPLQVKILDALTEAVGVPHQRGQSAFEIPERICTYNTWLEKELAKQRGG